MKTFAIIDLETTGNAASKGDRIIEIGIVLMEETGQVLQEFSSLVYPERSIPPFITSLTGINEDDVLHAPLFSEIIEDIYPLVKESYIVAHNIEFDLVFLNEEFRRCGYQSIHNPYIDTVELSRVLLPTSPSFKLGQLSERLGMGHDRPHRALSDAQATSDLLNHLFNCLDQLPERTLQYLLKLEPKLKSELRPFIQSSIEKSRYHPHKESTFELWHGIPVKKIDRVPRSNANKQPEFREWINDIFEDELGLKAHFPAYETRRGQRDMAEIVYQALHANKHALIEAGTGTGKTLAYLLAALYYSFGNGERLLITTHTTNLQKQLIEEEIPRLRSLFQRPVNAVVYKGRSHYINLLHFRFELNNSYHDNYDIALTKAMILVWLTKTSTGDVDEIQLPSNGRQFWHKVSFDQSKKSMHKSNQDESYYHHARQKAEQADLVITNHALFCMDLISEENRIPEYDRVIIDEAHHLEPVVNRYFGVRLHYKELQRQLSQATDLFQRKIYKDLILPKEFFNETVSCQYYTDKAKEELNQLSRYIYQNIRRQHKKKFSAKSDVGRIQFLLDQHEPLPFLTTAKEMADRFLASNNQVMQGLERMYHSIQLSAHMSEDHSVQVICTRIERQLNFFKQVKAKLTGYFEIEPSTQAKWIEIEGTGGAHAVYLFSEPIDIAPQLSRLLFEKKNSVIMTSGTLSTNDSFEYIRRLLGIEGESEIIEKIIPSPYDFSHQVQLMVPNDFPDIKAQKEEFIDAISEAIYSIAQVTNGRMLVLFTSYEMLKKTYTLLREVIDPEEFMIFAQGVSSGSRDRLKKNFQAFDKSILLGTSSFWEGIDIPGDDLSCVVMVRLPFQPPDQPLQTVRHQYMKEDGRNSFMEQSLPHAILRFKQGFGRLIRSNTDRGIIFICDQRIMEAKYGKYFLSSIPEIPISFRSTRELIHEIENWL